MTLKPSSFVPRMTLRPSLRAVALTLSLPVALATASARADGEASQIEPSQIQANQVVPARTAKERLGGKASDEQRVDNCKVPLEQRGSKPRPDDCRDGTSTEAKH